jgi:hypothetical protein
MYRLYLNDARGLCIPHTKAGARRFCKAIGWPQTCIVHVDLGAMAGEGYMVADISLAGLYRAPRHDQPAFRHFSWDSREQSPRLVRDVADHLHQIPFFDRVAMAWQSRAYMPNNGR